MKSKYLPVWLPCLVILAMLASLITPSPVLAASEPPPPPGEKSPHASQPAAKPAPPASDSSYTAEAPVAAPSGESNTAAVALSVDAIAQAGAVLVGADGGILPLAAQESAIVLGGGDYVAFNGSGGPECSAGVCQYANIATALANFPARNGSGMIYADNGLVEPGAVDVISAPALDLSKLTGLAWSGSYTASNYSPQITNGALTIANMLKGFTVDGFYIGRGIIAHDNAGTLRLQNLYVTNAAGTGIFVNHHKGNIDLFNVNVLGSSADGAYLDNTDGTGNVTVTNSSFNNNHQHGLSVTTNGSALLDQVEASNNLINNGVYLDVKKGATVKNGRFNNNVGIGNGYGMYISGTGTITLQNISAAGNSTGGLYIFTANDIKIDGSSLTSNARSFSVNSSGGNITLNNVVTQNNVNSALVNNYSPAGPVKTVMVTNSRFNGTTSGDGLRIDSKGSITLNNFQAQLNAMDGVYINNAEWYAVSNSYKGSGSISILSTLGSDVFYSNGNYAVEVKSKGSLTLKGVSLVDNGYGMYLDNCMLNPNVPANCLGSGSVTLSDVQVEDTTSNNGLYVSSGGAISLDRTGIANSLAGAYLSNALASASKTVSITHSSFFLNQVMAGLWVQSKGNITLNAVQAISNQGKQTFTPLAADVSGILLDNCLYDNGAQICRGSGSVSISSSLGSSQALRNPLGYGLLVHSKGTISVSGFSSLYNGNGAVLDNEMGGGAGAVTITNSAFNYSTSGTQGGLVIMSAKAMTLSGVQASYNNGYGASVNGLYGLSTTAAVTISKSNFDHNVDAGLGISSRGNLTLNNVSASGNGYLQGAGMQSTFGNVTVSDSLGPNNFSFNNGDGLSINSARGAISVSGVTAIDNTGGRGVYLNNGYYTSTSPVTAQRILSEHNASDGLIVDSKGSVTLNRVQANYNGSGYGVNIDNCQKQNLVCQGSGNVSILATLGSNSTSSNKYGLWIESAGSVLVNGLTASNNTTALYSVSGAWIENSFTAGKTVTVNQSSFNANNGEGLMVHSWGVITLNNVAASYNAGGGSGYGIYLENSDASTPVGISILSTLGSNQFNSNSYFGMFLTTKGNISLSKVSASFNGSSGSGYGAALITFGASSNITITCGAFNHNTAAGLIAEMVNGVLTLKSVTASGNGGAADITRIGGTAGPMGWTVCGY